MIGVLEQVLQFLFSGFLTLSFLFTLLWSGLIGIVGLFWTSDRFDFLMETKRLDGKDSAQYRWELKDFIIKTTVCLFWFIIHCICIGVIVNFIMENIL